MRVDHYCQDTKTTRTTKTAEQDRDDERYVLIYQMENQKCVLLLPPAPAYCAGSCRLLLPTAPAPAACSCLLRLLLPTGGTARLPPDVDQHRRWANNEQGIKWRIHYFVES